MRFTYNYKYDFALLHVPVYCLLELHRIQTFLKKMLMIDVKKIRIAK